MREDEDEFDNNDIMPKSELTPVCAECKHLMLDTPHVCPTPEYIKARDKMFEEILDIEEEYGIEALDGGDQ